MKYALAKRLRGAGLPQNGDGKLIGCPDAIIWRPADRVYVPTLSELIEVCGPSFLSLEQVARGRWKASSSDKGNAGGTYVTVEGDTPDEAVALLLLALKDL